jgi:acyl-CoA reductase-like NAD-dependent aldehyde dehydrogenase
MSESFGQLHELSRCYYVNGELRRSKGETYWEELEPATEEPLGHVADCTQDEIDEVVRIANETQREWKETSALERADLLHQVARDIRANQHEIAELQSREMGKPYKESHDETDWCISAIDYYAEAARHEYGKVLGPTVRKNFQYTIKEPIGVLLSIATYNYPNLLSTWEAASAIATGNTAIVKPSQLTSLVTLKYLEAWSALPPGVIQCVTGRGIAGKMVARPDIHGVAFTGGIEVGQKIARVCGEQFKPCLVEASGNDPFIVMPSAPMEMAVQGAAFAAFTNCGQVCTSAERIYVHEDVHDEFAERLAAVARGLRIGSPLDAVDMGPMASADDRDHYEAALKSALDQGAKLVCGGGRPAGLDKGWYVEPTVLVDVKPDFEVLKDEIFGPVAPIVKVKSLDEALEYSNRSHFGLGANIYTMDLAEAFRAIDEFEAGMVWVNAPLLDNDAGPFGGRKMSGIGRELGAEGLDIWRHTKLVFIDPAASAHDFWWFPYKDEEAHPRTRN